MTENKFQYKDRVTVTYFGIFRDMHAHWAAEGYDEDGLLRSIRWREKYMPQYANTPIPNDMDKVDDLYRTCLGRGAVIPQSHSQLRNNRTAALCGVIQDHRGEGTTTALARAALECGGIMLVSTDWRAEALRNMFPSLRVFSYREGYRMKGRRGPLFIDTDVFQHIME